MKKRAGSSKQPTQILAPSLLSILILLAAVARAGEGSAPPKDFRSWAHSKSTVVADKANSLHGFHNQYVNKTALPPLRKGGEYKDGAVFVDSVNAVEEKNGIYVPGQKVKTLVMIRSKKAESTGGWGFQAFGPPGKPLKIEPGKKRFGSP